MELSLGPSKFVLGNYVFVVRVRIQLNGIEQTNRTRSQVSRVNVFVTCILLPVQQTSQCNPSPMIGASIHGMANFNSSPGTRVPAKPSFVCLLALTQWSGREPAHPVSMRLEGKGSGQVVAIIIMVLGCPICDTHQHWEHECHLI